ncbi:hypothetical protein, partial [Nonomuraea sp. LPB2021202275-12-8]|uniref:hypothetical protein n=1 Tax=Nonomuraea sp. LPB2021202275-12-8 TaxID=3120159 RepID=UPI00300D8246
MTVTTARPVARVATVLIAVPPVVSVGRSGIAMIVVRGVRVVTVPTVGLAVRAVTARLVGLAPKVAIAVVTAVPAGKAARAVRSGTVMTGGLVLRVPLVSAVRSGIVMTVVRGVRVVTAPIVARLVVSVGRSG